MVLGLLLAIAQSEQLEVGRVITDTEPLMDTKRPLKRVRQMNILVYRALSSCEDNQIGI